MVPTFLNVITGKSVLKKNGGKKKDGENKNFQKSTRNELNIN